LTPSAVSASTMPTIPQTSSETALAVSRVAWTAIGLGVSGKSSAESLLEAGKVADESLLEVGKVSPDVDDSVAGLESKAQALARTNTAVASTAYLIRLVRDMKFSL
jgi:hypothetical protein